MNVFRRDKRKTNPGEPSRIVVSPLFQSEGLFSEGGRAELHFTGDERRILVDLRVDPPRVLGSLMLHQKSIPEGFPARPESRAEVPALRERRKGAPAAR